MPAHLTWHIDHKVILWEYSGDVTRADVEDAHRQLAPMLKLVSAPVYAIIDLQNAGQLKFDMHEVATMPADDLDWWRLKRVVYVGKETSILFRAIADALSSVRSMPIDWFSTRQEALVFLCQQDESVCEAMDDLAED